MYSWINEALAEGGGDGERFSELIPDTVGGRTREQIQAYQRQQQNQQNQQAQLHNTSGRNSSSGDSAFARRIQQHFQPGDGAQRLYKMVQQPFRVKFGNGEMEQQRAGSSAIPPLTPFFKDAHPLICNDSPRPKPITQSAGTQTTPPVASASPRHFHRPPIASTSPFSSTTTTTVRRRAQSLADFPPLYNFSQRPLTHIRHSSLGENSGADPNFYRRRFINSLLKEIRRSKDLERKLDGRREELDEACRRDAHELGTIRRERELLVRELEMQSREYELEERSRHSSSSLTRQPSPPPPTPAPPKQPILKQQTNGASSRNNRVNFASPISTSLKSTSSSRQTRTSSPLGARADASKQREQGQKSRAYEMAFHEQQQRAKCRNPANSSSIFQYVHHHNPPPRK
ncbi:hypothetical protein niasHT_025407 [Heterodera trifolii]|uniref:Uncharacterized protein n=1 Tax=Heterodera trifolii TaxID=157864 RepID=A0ABD2KFI1_9BILA